MGILSLFRKPSSEEAARFLVEHIVLASLLYRKELAHPDDQRSADAGVEVAYLLLHLLDRELFGRFGASRREVLFDPIAQAVVARYTKAVLRPETPSDLLFDAAKQMQDTLNERQMTYAKCESLLGDPFPGIGTMVFAFCFFVHRALGRTNRTDVDDILAGDKSKLSQADLSDFPDAEFVFRGAVWIGSILKPLRLQDQAKYLGKR